MAVKQWQNLSALSKVKAGLEALAVELAFTLEAVLDSEDQGFIRDKLAECRDQLAQIGGVVSSLDFPELALLVREMQLLLDENRPTKTTPHGEQSRDAWQLLFVACTDFPAILEGLLSGSLMRWSDYSLLFNKVRKARNASLVFSSRPLLASPQVAFDQLFKTEPERMAELARRQLKQYDKARALLQQGDHVQGLELMGKVFGNLEVMYRNFRLGSLWGLCGVLVDSLRTGSAAPGGTSLKLLCSFSNPIQEVARLGVEVLDQNIPEKILEHVLNQVAGLEEGPDALRAAKLWYNLDLKLCREQRRAWRTLMVSWFRREAFTKAAGLITDDINLLSDAINEETAGAGRSEEKLREFMATLERIQGTFAALGFDDFSGELVACLEHCESLCEDFVHADDEEVDGCLYKAAQLLYQCELTLQAKTEEQNRAVLSAGEEQDVIVGPKLMLVVTASKNIEMAIIAVNNFVEADYDRGKLGDAVRLLKETEIALTAAQLDELASFSRGARCYVEYIPDLAEASDSDMRAFNDFVRMLIHMSLYLEQLVSGETNQAGHILQALDRLAPALDVYVAACPKSVPLAAVPTPDEEEAEAEGGDKVPEKAGGGPVLTLVSQTQPRQEAESEAADATAAATGMSAASAALKVIEVDEEVDEEIKEVFLEETAEILETLDENLAILNRESGNEEALKELRRSFHTLKGSGRMARALALGELGWSVENVLNNVLSGRIELDAALLDRIARVRAGLPGMIDDYRNGHACATDPGGYAEASAAMNVFLEPHAGETPAPAHDSSGESAKEFSNDEALAPAGESAAENDRDTMETFVLEAGRQIEAIRRLLEQGAQAVSSTDFLIPVHTLYGCCRMADFESLGRLVAPLEKLIDDHPHHKLTPELGTLFSDFCTMTEHLVGFVDRQKMWPADDEVLVCAEANAYTETRVQSLLARSLYGETGAAEDALTEQQDKQLPDIAAEEVTDTEASQDEEAMILAGFLREARASAAQVNNLFEELLAQPERFERSAHLPYQLRLLASASQVAEQISLGALCEALAGFYQQHSVQAFKLEDKGSALLKRAHAQIDQTLARLEAGAQAEDSAGLIVELRQYLNEALARKQLDADEDSEDDLLAVFLEEAAELLHEVDERIADWQQDPSDDTVSDDLLRCLHTLKGNAALAGDHEFSEEAHGFETLIIDARRTHHKLDREFFNEVDARLSTLQQLFSLYQRNEDGRIVRVEPQAGDLETVMFDAPQPEEAVQQDIAEQQDDMPEQQHASEQQDTHEVQETLEPVDEQQADIEQAEASIEQEELAPEQLEQITNEEEPPLLELSARVETLPPEALLPEPETQAAETEAREDSTAAQAPQQTAASARDQQTVLDEQVRVSGNLLKDLLNEADEINVSRNRIEQNIAEFNILLSDMDETLGRLQSYIMNFEAQTETVSHSMQRIASAEAGEEAAGESLREFDTLEMDRYTELHQIFLSMLEDYDDLRDIKQNLSTRIRGIDTILTDQQRSTNKLQDGLITSQMVPFSGIVPRLRRLTRQVAQELDKQVTIRFSNPEGKIDRGVLQVLVGPLEHMIRNAIDHGVETPEDRRAAGKPEEAEILVKLHRQGANILLDISDDGKGIDVLAVRRQAVNKGLMEENEVLSDQQAYQFILKPGFSTSSKVSKISGRGVGLDVVDSEIRQIGGEIEISSTRGRGSTFRVRLPLTSSLNRTLLFKIGSVRYAMLLNTIDAIVLETAEHLRNYYGQEATPLIQYAGASYELAYMGSVLDAGWQPRLDGIDHSVPLLLVSANRKNMALQVDSIIGSRDLVVKSLGAQFAAIPGLSGAVILGDGEVVMVLDPVSLIDAHVPQRIAPHIAAANEVARIADAEAEAGPARNAKTVLVVDDSITVRKVTSAILKRNGMNVILAKNGMEAVDILQTTKPDLMLLDIEMPKMDGFEVASYIRRQEDEVKDLPIIMITSRIGDKHRSKAEEIGVNQYMCKPFQEQNLLEAIAQYN